ncbi:MAG: hypothetical protein ACJ8G3_22390 [Burkholderiaceae bacterium]
MRHDADVMVVGLVHLSALPTLNVDSRSLQGPVEYGRTTFAPESACILLARTFASVLRQRPATGGSGRSPLRSNHRRYGFNEEKE